jgi:SecD/SecF fusion protein
VKKVFFVLVIAFGSLIAGIFLLAVLSMLVFWGLGRRPLFAHPHGDVLVYEVDPRYQPKDMPVDMQKVCEAVIRRMSSGTLLADVSVIPQGKLRVAVYAPGREVRDRVERLMAMTGTLEFRILANNRDHRTLMRRADADSSDTVILESGGDRSGWWVPLAPGAVETKTFILRDPKIKTRTRKIGKHTVTEVLVADDPYNVTGDYLNSVSATFGPEGATVLFGLNSMGASKFSELTGRNLPDPDGFCRKLGIILDGKLYSAPSIRSRIGDRGQITGIGSEEEVETTVAVLKAGPLPVRLRKVEGE